MEKCHFSTESFVCPIIIEAIYKIVCPLVSCEQCLNFTSFVKEWTTMTENLDSEQRNRLWEHRLFIESQIYGRANLFLVIETVLLAVVGANSCIVNLVHLYLC